MEKLVVDEQNGLEYELVGDYYIVAGEDEPPARPIGVWGAMRRDYLKQHRQNVYYGLLFSGKLNDHLADIEEQAQDMIWNLTKQMAKADGIGGGFYEPSRKGIGRSREARLIRQNENRTGRTDDRR